MVKLENVLGGSVQFHFNIAEKLHKIVVIAEGVTTVYDEDEVLAMLKVWNHLGEALESDKMAVDLGDLRGIFLRRTRSAVQCQNRGTGRGLVSSSDSTNEGE